MSSGLTPPPLAAEPPAPIQADPIVANPSAPMPSPGPARAASSRFAGLWVRTALAVALLAASAGARHWQAGRVDSNLRSGRVSPFPLASIPMNLGEWEGAEEKMDSAIARATGSTDNLFRTYQHRRTGQKVSVIVLFGPSTEMYVHTPENCYPAAGYSRVIGPAWRDVKIGPDESRPFYSLVFAKGEGGGMDRQEVLYTWRYSDRWSPTLVTPKGLERIPGMFKVHVSRPVRSEAEMDNLDVDSPCESFLAGLMPEIEARLKPAAPARAH